MESEEGLCCHVAMCTFLMVDTLYLLASLLYPPLHASGLEGGRVWENAQLAPGPLICNGIEDMSQTMS